MRALPRWLGTILVGLLLAASPARAGSIDAADDACAPRHGHDEDRRRDRRELRGRLPRLLDPIDRFLERSETDGVTRDSRSLGNPPEEIRLSVVPQLLAFCELDRSVAGRRYRQDIADRAEFLLRNLDLAVSGSSSDGMLAFALLDAYSVTGDDRYRLAAAPMLDRFRHIAGFDARLNWGLMAALALAEDYRQTRNPASLEKVKALVTGVAFEQQSDGSWPHVCYGSRDIHYTAWMSQELILIGQRIGADPTLEKALASAYGFLSQRLDSVCVTHYELPVLGGSLYFYSRATGCAVDYDTRGWNNELGYHALLFEHFHDDRLPLLLDLLEARQDRGAFADKWDFFPPPSDPIYPWASDAHSVIRTSVIFWSLAALSGERRIHARERLAESDAGGGPAGGMDESDAVPETLGEATAGAADAGLSSSVRFPDFGLSSSPNPATAGCAIAMRMPGPAEASLEIFDSSGRRIRTLLRGPAAAGERTVRWNGRDDAGALAPAGVYLLRLRADGRQVVARLAFVR